MDSKYKNFPKDFLWGASTATHQVEGGNHNQWSVWELQNAKELARTAEDRLSWLPEWDKFKKQAEDPDNYISGQGVSHYGLYKEDFKIIKNLNLDSFRFGVEWARIEPEEGEWDESAIQHYRDYIAELKKLGIKPFLNIWHWTLPVWFTDRGGFTKSGNIIYFERFVQKIADELLQDVDYVITLNEPNVYTGLSYFSGEWPPEEKSLWRGLKVYWNLVQAHKKSYKILKNAKPAVQVGVAAQLANAQPKNPKKITDRLTTNVSRYFWNWWFLDRIKKHQDFIGFNYYFTDYYSGLGKQQNPDNPHNDMGWYAEPEGLYKVLVAVKNRYYRPIYVTENGIADGEDQYRQWWIEETMQAMDRAISDGVDLKGYFHWSLLDNFEWKYGWWAKFGLVEVDRTNNMKRTIRPSAKWWANQLKDLQK
jgi:beta-glucosidase